MLKKLTSFVSAAGISSGAIAVPAEISLKLYAEGDCKGWFATYTTPGNKTISPNWNDTLSSFDNQLNYDVAFFHDAQQKGACFTGKRMSKAAWFAAWDDNKVSSLRIGAGC